MDDRKNSLQNRVALVTGSSRGIGAAIAIRFAQAGARVVVHGRDAAAIAAVRKQIEAAGGTVMAVSGDVTHFAEIETMRQQIEGAFGPVDILVANAGASLTRPGPLEEISEEGWRATVDANLTATFLTLKSFLPGMKERKSGNIITISSAAARRPSSRSPIPYTAAKAGIQLLTHHIDSAGSGTFRARSQRHLPRRPLLSMIYRSASRQAYASRLGRGRSAQDPHV